MAYFVELFGLSEKTILEVGSGKGEMLGVLTEVGVDAIGIEPSEEAVRKGRAEGNKIIEGYIDNADKMPDCPYEEFACFNFLEHMPHLASVIRKLYDRTTSNAAGFVTVPNLAYLIG